MNTTNLAILKVVLQGDLPDADSRNIGQLHVGQGGMVYLLVDDSGNILEQRRQIELSSTEIQMLVQSTILEAATDEPEATIKDKQRWLDNIRLETQLWWYSTSI